MFFLGITGGVGAGKTELLKHLAETYDCRVLLADALAHDLMEPGTACYGELRALLGAADVWAEESDGENPSGQDPRFDRGKLAALLFSDGETREKVNAIVHPAVKEEVRSQAAADREGGAVPLFVLEAALLIEEGYGAICDELWAVTASEEARRERLKKSRGYSDERIDATLKSQLSDEAYRAHCAEVIDNSGTPEEAFAQVDALLKKRGITPRLGRSW